MPLDISRTFAEIVFERLESKPVKLYAECPVLQLVLCLRVFRDRVYANVGIPFHDDAITDLPILPLNSVPKTFWIHLESLLTPTKDRAWTRTRARKEHVRCHYRSRL